VLTFGVAVYEDVGVEVGNSLPDVAGVYVVVGWNICFWAIWLPSDDPVMFTNPLITSPQKPRSLELEVGARVSEARRRAVAVPRAVVAAHERWSAKLWS
jgi:hypothetical protein